MLFSRKRRCLSDAASFCPLSVLFLAFSPFFHVSPFFPFSAGPLPFCVGTDTPFASRNQEVQIFLLSPPPRYYVQSGNSIPLWPCLPPPTKETAPGKRSFFSSLCNRCFLTNPLANRLLGHDRTGKEPMKFCAIRVEDGSLQSGGFTLSTPTVSLLF